jgi:DNA-binding NarL/FixJ family response regulator
VSGPCGAEQPTVSQNMFTANEKPKRRVFLVDDHPLVREWLTSLINQQHDLLVVGEAADAAQALERVATAKPDVAVLDIALRDASGIELIKQMKLCLPKLLVLVLSMHEESVYAHRALQAGAKGYVMKRESTKTVIEALRLVLQGRIYLSSDTTNAVLTQFASGQPPSVHALLERLSDRELEVFEMLGQGMSTRQIAERLRLSIKTIQAYCVNMKEKLSLETATDLLREALLYHDQSPYQR